MPFKKNGLVLYNEDCLNILPSLPEKSVDFLVTDIPYEMTKTLITRKGAKDLNSDFGSWDVFLTDWIEPAFRVLKDNSGMVVFVPAQRYETLFKISVSVGFEHVQPWFFYRTNPTPVFRRGLQWAVEMMGYFVKGVHKLNIENRGRCHNVFQCPATGGGKKRIHPTQKPLKLMQNIVELVSKDGDTILDCFSGSGTTGIAALGLNRKYIGIEKDPDFYRKSVERFERFFDDIFGGETKCQ